MRPPIPIDRRLSETKPSTVSEALLVSVVKKHKSGLGPSLPTSTLKRIERTLGEHPPRLRPVPAWRVLRTVAAVVVAVVSVQAIAVVGNRLVEVARMHLARKKIGRDPARNHGPLPDSFIATATPPALPPPPAPSPRHAGTLNSFDTGHPFPSAAQPVERPSPVPDPLDVEATQLKRGLEFKRAGNLTSAIATLEHYRQAYPRGSFRMEASIAEIDAQLSLGHREEALSLLEEVGEDPGLPRSAELRLLRAELAARRGRCAEALAGFEASRQIPSLAERALYGQASCQQALGRFSESRSAFEEYLSRYPHGSLATEARRALGSSR
jgi:tetratricopeptide (TPR) repeat protein